MGWYFRFAETLSGWTFWGSGRFYAFFFLTSLPSYSQMAFIHSSGSGLDSCLSRSNATMTEVQMHFTSSVSTSITRWMRWKLLVPISDTAVCTAIRSDAKIWVRKFASMWTTTIPSFSQSTLGRQKRNILFFQDRKMKSKPCCWHDRICLHHWSVVV